MKSHGIPTYVGMLKMRQIALHWPSA